METQERVKETMFTLIHVADPKIAQAVVEYLSERYQYPGSIRYESQDFGERQSIVAYVSGVAPTNSIWLSMSNIAKAFADGANWQKKVHSYLNAERDV
jgi:hypothetical protein